jgi:hypothetical protein
MRITIDDVRSGILELSMKRIKKDEVPYGMYV